VRLRLEQLLEALEVARVLALDHPAHQRREQPHRTTHAEVRHRLQAGAAGNRREGLAGADRDRAAQAAHPENAWRIVRGDLVLGLGGPAEEAAAVAAACAEAYVPEVDAAEAALVDGVAVVGVGTLGALMNHLRGDALLPPAPRPPPAAEEPAAAHTDLADVRG
jgi:predicted ATPase with chaperone activity